MSRDIPLPSNLHDWCSLDGATCSHGLPGALFVLRTGLTPAAHAGLMSNFNHDDIAALNRHAYSSTHFIAKSSPFRKHLGKTFP